MEIIASEFKAKCLHLMDEVAKTGEPIIITKHGKPIAQLVSIKPKPSNLFGAFKDLIEITGDITEPIDVEWGALNNQDNNDDTL
jgi:prevent-host-death family protein